MIELDFVEDVLMDRQKDHEVRSYHISMVEKVIKGFKYDEFIIELTARWSVSFKTLWASNIRRTFVLPMAKNSL